jgi:hypothetical protein
MPNDSGRPGYHNRHSCIVAKISSLLASLAQEPSRSREETARTLEYWIGYVLTEQFTTVDELVEGVSYIAWEGGNPYIVASFLKEFRNAPAVPSKRHRSWTSYASAFFDGFRSPQPKATTSVRVTDGLDKKELQVRPVLHLSASWQTLTCRPGTSWTHVKSLGMVPEEERRNAGSDETPTFVTGNPFSATIAPGAPSHSKCRRPQVVVCSKTMCVSFVLFLVPQRKHEYQSLKH